MKIERVREITEKIKDVKIAVYGDFCLDVYWPLDPKGGEMSVETGIQAEAVSQQSYSLGGASNIVANLTALNPALIKVIGVRGDDVFGRELERLLKEKNVDTSELFIQKENFDTFTYIKRILEDKEQPRIDFGFLNKRSAETDEKLLAGIEKALQEFDIIIFNQQVVGSIPNKAFIEKVNELCQKYPDKNLVFDSRHYGAEFHYVLRKLNDIEAGILNGVEYEATDVITVQDAEVYAKALYERSKKPVVLTRGGRGILVCDETGVTEIPGIQLLKKLDTVGAGDTTISALALCLAAGIDTVDAARFANMAAAVTVQKLYTTGTANAEEIMQIASDTNYLYQPELADDPRKAQYYKDTEIELTYSLDSMQFGRIKFAVFDHDGTISTLRQGWEAIMEPMMVKAILGDQYETAGETLYHNVVQRVRDFIDQSVGIQTILQMEALVELVKEFGIVPEDQILDKFGYKEIYNDALMISVRKRMAKLERKELSTPDWTMKGAVEFLQSMRDKGVTLYMASGTDKEDVINEAKTLGYADLFNGGIYGAVGDVSKFSKKMLIEQIMKENNLHGSELVVFGDGPVEIRECRKRDGIAVGIASDELQRHSLNIDKRTRLIKAGAQVVIPDYSQRDYLMDLLFNG